MSRYLYILTYAGLSSIGKHCQALELAKGVARTLMQSSILF